MRFSVVVWTLVQKMNHFLDSLDVMLQTFKVMFGLDDVFAAASTKERSAHGALCWLWFMYYCLMMKWCFDMNRCGVWVGLVW